ncbi:hypothetical protein TIFTF001_025419 [Ficus carica]|uniref:Uncharacterized protein n=1 Tax=Ficus carica TaxID=3494 RepID=A0AA88AJT9_FICCA|nr:hypothetical protein TIFTF001_025419 [Ficus carica]
MQGMDESNSEQIPRAHPSTPPESQSSARPVSAQPNEGARRSHCFCKNNNHKKILKFRAIVNRFTYGLAAEREIGSESGRFVDRPSPAMASVAAPCSPEI